MTSYDRRHERLNKHTQYYTRVLCLKRKNRRFGIRYILIIGIIFGNIDSRDNNIHTIF